jgi:hypothetical protein
VLTLKRQARPSGVEDIRGLQGSELWGLGSGVWGLGRHLMSSAIGRLLDNFAVLILKREAVVVSVRALAVLTIRVCFEQLCHGQRHLRSIRGWLCNWGWMWVEEFQNWGCGVRGWR